MKNILLLVVVVLSISSCKTQQAPITFSFGTGGGFTGGYTTYSFANDGKLFKEQSLDKTNVQLGTLTKKQVKEAIEQSAKVNFAALNINNPGNLSNFVNVKQGDAKSYKTTWSGATSGNAALDAFSKYLNTLIPKK